MTLDSLVEQFFDVRLDHLEIADGCLSDRTAETLAAWLETEIEVVMRDRATEYERGVSLGAPQATQVLDRWHLLKNLREACERQLCCFQKAIDAVANEVGADYLRVPRSKEAAREGALEKRRGQEVRDLHAQGMSISAIAKQRPAAPLSAAASCWTLYPRGEAPIG